MTFFHFSIEFSFNILFICKNFCTVSYILKYIKYKYIYILYAFKIGNMEIYFNVWQIITSMIFFLFEFFSFFSILSKFKFLEVYLYSPFLYGFQFLLFHFLLLKFQSRDRNIVKKAT